MSWHRESRDFQQSQLRAEPQLCMTYSSDTTCTLQHTQSLDRRWLVGLYFTAIFTCRLLLRSKLADGLHWALVMVLEDGMSLLSFALGLLYLHRNNGGPLGLVAKCFSGTSEDLGTSSAQSWGTPAEQPLRLFRYAL